MSKQTFDQTSNTPHSRTSHGIEEEEQFTSRERKPAEQELHTFQCKDTELISNDDRTICVCGNEYCNVGPFVLLSQYRASAQLIYNERRDRLFDQASITRQDAATLATSYRCSCGKLGPKELLCDPRPNTKE